MYQKRAHLKTFDILIWKCDQCGDIANVNWFAESDEEPVGSPFQIPDRWIFVSNSVCQYHNEDVCMYNEIEYLRAGECFCSERCMIGKIRERLQSRMFKKMLSLIEVYRSKISDIGWGVVIQVIRHARRIAGRPPNMVEISPESNCGKKCNGSQNLKGGRKPLKK